MILNIRNLIDRFNRWVCSWYGHDWRDDSRGAPAIPLFAVCVRCGKWTRLVNP